MKSKTKLELTWIGKENHPQLEPRILIEDRNKSYHAKQRVTDSDIFDNILIHGDNLLALKALEHEYTGKVKCIYIDPPFNTGQALENYDDGVEHSLWLSLMQERLVILHRLLSRNGTCFVHIDDNELGYLIVLMDEIFGRSNRLYAISFKQGSATGHKAINPGCVNTTNFILMYAKEKASWHPKRIFTARDRDTRYNQFIVNRETNYQKWRTVPLIQAVADFIEITVKSLRKRVKEDPELLDSFVMNHADSVVRLARPDYKSVSAAARELIDKSKLERDNVHCLVRKGYSDMYFTKGERILFYSNKLKQVDGKRVAGEPLTTLWDDILSNNIHKEGGVKFPKGKKPELLIKRILDLVTDEGDLVLDSFAGSGTTGAVAHKMGRRWIMIELRDHFDTHIIPRLQRTVDGTDQDGASKTVNWMGGGGFRCYHLAPSLLEKDKWGNWVISKEYNAVMLAEAMCVHEGFTYLPNEEIYWQHGHSTETDFIYVTTQMLNHPQLVALSDEVGSKRSLLVCCAAFRGNVDDFPNLTLKKIPKAVLHNCEWGHDDYSLEVSSLPSVPTPEERAEKLIQELPLFAIEEKDE